MVLSTICPKCLNICFSAIIFFVQKNLYQICTSESEINPLIESRMCKYLQNICVHSDSSR